jgi:hypothetical protein
VDLARRQFVDQLDWSQSKVIRIENGKVALAITDLQAALRPYAVEDRATIPSLDEIARGPSACRSPTSGAFVVRDSALLRARVFGVGHPVSRAAARSRPTADQGVHSGQRQFEKSG